MAWTDLPTNYQDAAWEGSRKFNMIKNSDGSYSFEDVTEYTQIDRAYRGASDVNATNNAINTLMGIVDGAYKLLEPTNVQIKNGDGEGYLTWTDPDNGTVDYDTTVVQWAGTLVKRKAGSPPDGYNDSSATTIINEKMRNQYKTNAFTDANLTNGTTYYYGIYPYSREGKYTDSFVASFTPSHIELETPELLSVRTTSNSASIEFNNPNVAGRLKIVYKIGSAPSSPNDGTIYEVVSGSPALISGLTKNKLYYFVAYAYTSSGNARSNVLSETTIEGAKIFVTIDGLPTGTEVTVNLRDNTDDSFSASSKVAQGATIQVGELPTNHSYTISSTDIVKYATPTEISGIAETDVRVTETLTYVKYPSLNEYTWAEINTISEEGTAPKHFAVGDEKTINYQGVEHIVAIAGFNKYINSRTGEKGGITFTFKYCLNDPLTLTGRANAHVTPKGWSSAADYDYYTWGGPNNYNGFLTQQLLDKCMTDYEDDAQQEEWFSYVKPTQIKYYFPHTPSITEVKARVSISYTSSDTKYRNTKTVNQVKLFPFSAKNLRGDMDSFCSANSEVLEYYTQNQNNIYKTTASERDVLVAYYMVGHQNAILTNKYISDIIDSGDADGNEPSRCVDCQDGIFVMKPYSGTDSYGNPTTNVYRSELSAYYKETVTAYVLLGFVV